MYHYVHRYTNYSTNYYIISTSSISMSRFGTRSTSLASPSLTDVYEDTPYEINTDDSELSTHTSPQSTQLYDTEPGKTRARS